MSSTKINLQICIQIANKNSISTLNVDGTNTFSTLAITVATTEGHDLSQTCVRMFVFGLEMDEDTRIFEAVTRSKQLSTMSPQDILSAPPMLVLFQFGNKNLKEGIIVAGQKKRVTAGDAEDNSRHIVTRKFKKSPEFQELCKEEDRIQEEKDHECSERRYNEWIDIWSNRTVGLKKRQALLCPLLCSGGGGGGNFWTLSRRQSGNLNIALNLQMLLIWSCAKGRGFFWKLNYNKYNNKKDMVISMSHVKGDIRE